MMLENFLAQHLDGVEKCVNVQTLAVVLSLHVFEADFDVGFECRTHFAEARHTSKSSELVGCHQLRLLASLYHYFKQLLRFIPYVVFIELSVFNRQNLLEGVVKI